MAKSKSFFGLRKGSTKTMTFSVLRGQQITKDRVTDIANPRTQDQTQQRIPFAQAVKFYRQATRGLFRFAYEDKRPLESDYNAFMRHNVKYASSVSYTNYNTPEYPAIGNWLLAQGSLPQADVQLNVNAIALGITAATSAISTVGHASSALLATYNGLVEGDIVTFVAFNTQVTSSGSLDGLVAPVMGLVQFVINTNDTTTLASLGLEGGSVGATSFGWDIVADEYAGFGAVIFSRNSPSGLKVSDASIVGNAIWNGIMEEKTDKNVKIGDAISWGSTDKAILQGALSD